MYTNCSSRNRNDCKIILEKQRIFINHLKNKKMKTEKKFFFNKEDNATELLAKLDREQMNKLSGGIYSRIILKENGGGTYTESTYVRS